MSLDVSYRVYRRHLDHDDGFCSRKAKHISFANARGSFDVGARSETISEAFGCFDFESTHLDETGPKRTVESIGSGDLKDEELTS